jgi:nucleoside-diphosphate-sugar epimerase
VRRNIFLSSMSARATALSHYGRQKYEIEKLFDTSNDTVIRPGLVLGNGGLFSEMVKFIRGRKLVPLINGGKQPLQTVHIDDLVTSIDAVIEKNLPGSFTVAEPVPVEYREFWRVLGETIGVRPVFVPVPSFVISAALKVFAIMRVKIPISKENLLGLKSLIFIETKADLEKLGITARSWKDSLSTLDKNNE